jgi:membrane protein YqaA with SNARE-associated domain
VSNLFYGLLRFLFHAGYLGPFLMGVMDSSFLFLPFGNDVLVVLMVARNHQGYPFYVLSAVCGSSLGVFLMDLVARKSGEAGVRKVAGDKRFERLRNKVSRHGALALVVGCLAPPPFPFTMVVATESTLGYPRARLLALVAAARGARFLVLGYLAIRFGEAILRIAKTPAFEWTIVGFAVLCAVGSVFSIMKWLRRGRPGRPAEAAV